MWRKALSADTSVDAERVQIERWRAMTPAEKLHLVSSISRTAFALTLAGLRHRHPDESEREIFLRFAVINLGRELAERAYPELASLAPE